MTTNNPEVIYLIDTGDGVVWCDDPDPTGYAECNDAVKYVRGDVYEALQAECEELRKDAAGLVEALEHFVEWYELLNLRNEPCFQFYDMSKKALVAYRKGGDV